MLCCNALSIRFPTPTFYLEVKIYQYMFQWVSTVNAFLYAFTYLTLTINVLLSVTYWYNLCKSAHSWNIVIFIQRGLMVFYPCICTYHSQTLSLLYLEKIWNLRQKVNIYCSAPLVIAVLQFHATSDSDNQTPSWVLGVALNAWARLYVCCNSLISLTWGQYYSNYNSWLSASSDFWRWMSCPYPENNVLHWDQTWPGYIHNLLIYTHFWDTSTFFCIPTSALYLSFLSLTPYWFLSNECYSLTLLTRLYKGYSFPETLKEHSLTPCRMKLALNGAALGWVECFWELGKVDKLPRITSW